MGDGPGDREDPAVQIVVIGIDAHRIDSRHDPFQPSGPRLHQPDGARALPEQLHVDRAELMRALRAASDGVRSHQEVVVVTQHLADERDRDRALEERRRHRQAARRERRAQHLEVVHPALPQQLAQLGRHEQPCVGGRRRQDVHQLHGRTGQGGQFQGPIQRRLRGGRGVDVHEDTVEGHGHASLRLSGGQGAPQHLAHHGLRQAGAELDL